MTPSKRTSVATKTMVLLGTCVSAAVAAPEKLSLWPDKAPIGEGQFETVVTTIAVYRPTPEKATGTAMIICPDGGYGGLVTGAEGHGIAKGPLFCATVGRTTRHPHRAL